MTDFVKHGFMCLLDIFFIIFGSISSSLMAIKILC